MADGELERKWKTFLPVALVEKSHLLGCLFQYALILDPALERKYTFMKEMLHYKEQLQPISTELQGTKIITYNWEQHKLLEELLRIISVEVSKVSF